MAFNINRGFEVLRRSSAQVSMLNPNQTIEKCSPYLKLSKGRNVLVTMPEVNHAACFSSNFMLPKVNDLAQKLLRRDFKTFVLIPNKDIEMREWLHQMQVTHFSIFCDPEIVISDTLGITVSYQGGPAKYPKSPAKLHILMIDGTVSYVAETDKDHEFLGLLKKASKIFSKSEL